MRPKILNTRYKTHRGQLHLWIALGLKIEYRTKDPKLGSWVDLECHEHLRESLENEYHLKDYHSHRLKPHAPEDP